MAGDEGRLRAGRAHDRDEDLQPPRGRRRPWARASPDPAPDRHEPRPARGRARRPLPRALVRPRRPAGGDAARVRRARPGRQGRRRRRVQLHRRAARGGGRALGARGADALRVGAELVLPARPRGRGDRLSGLPRARPRVRGVRAARGRLASGEVPPRRGLPGGVADDAAPGQLPPVCERRGLRRPRGLRARGARSRRLHGRARDRVAARRARRHRRRRRADARRAARAGARGVDTRPHRRPTATICEACSREPSRPGRARRPAAARHGVVHRGDGRGADRARARRALPAAPLRRSSARRERVPRAHAGPSRGRERRLLAQGDRRHADEPDARPGRAPGRGPPPRRRDGPARRGAERVPGDRDPHRRRLRRRHPRARPRRRRAGRDPGSRRSGAGACRSDASRARRSRDQDLGAEPRRRGAASGARSEAIVAPSVDAALFGAEVVCTTTSAAEPIVELRWLAEGAHVNAVGSSIPTTRELDTATVAAATLFVDRRESTLNEAGDYLLAAAEGAVGPDHIAAELGDVLTGSHPGPRCETELTVFKSLGSRSRTSQQRNWSCAARGSRASARRSSSDPARADRERTRADREHVSCARRSFGCTSRTRPRRSGSSSRACSRSARSSCAAPRTRS